MKVKPLSIALLTGCLALSQLAYSAPTDIEVVEKNNQRMITKINTDENNITHVMTQINGTQYELSFTPQELNDKEGIEQKVSALPKEVQKPIAAMLERVPLHTSPSKSPRDPKIEKAIKIKLEKLHQQLSGKEAEIEAHAMKLESKARVLEEKARELEVIFEQNEGQFEIRMESLGDDIAVLTEQITELELERLGLNGDASRVLIIQEPIKRQLAALSRSDILALIERAELTKEEKQKLTDILMQK